MITPLQFIVSDISSQLQREFAESSQGQGRMLGVNYAYQAQSVLFLAPARRFDPDAADFRTYEPRYRLYDIELTVTYRGRSREFQYQDIAWLDNQN